MRAIYWLVWKVLRIPSVVLVDFDGEQNPRYIRWADTDHPFANRMQFVRSHVRLLSDGSTSGVSYVKRWRPLYPPIAQQTSDHA